jgi:hypothetical protein
MTLCLDRVSYHAVIRYCQRILGIELQVSGHTPRACAEAYAHAAGMTLDEVRLRIWTPGIAFAVQFGVCNVSNGIFAVRISQPVGVIATVLNPFTHNEHRLRVLSMRELRVKAKRNERRLKRRPTATDAMMPGAPTEEE